MKVVLIKTPEVDINSVIEILEFLRKFNGPIEFEFVDFTFDRERYYFLDRIVGHVYQFGNVIVPRQTYNPILPQQKQYLGDNDGLLFSTLFSLCKNYREVNKDRSSIVVLLTRRNNILNFYSFFDGERNAFVRVDHQNIYHGIQSGFAIAFQIVENIFAVLMNLKIDIEDYFSNEPLEEKYSDSHSETGDNQYFHEVPLGCINDLCRNKRDILFKLKSGKFCYGCLMKIIREIDKDTFLQLTAILAEVSNKFKHGDDPVIKTYLSKEDSDSYSLIIQNEKQIIFKKGNREEELQLQQVEKALYLFLLEREDGIRVKELPEYKNQLNDIYNRLWNSKGTHSAIETLCQQNGAGFNPVCSRVNTKVNSLFNYNNSKLFLITGKRGDQYKVNYPLSKIIKRWR